MIPKATGEGITAAMEARVVEGESPAALRAEAPTGVVNGRSFMTQEAGDFGLKQTGPHHYRCEVEIVNDQGLHLRPVTEFATLAQRFESRIFIYKGNQKVDGKDPFDLLMLEAVAGTQLVIEACGADASEALAQLARLVRSGFPIRKPAS